LCLAPHSVTIYRSSDEYPAACKKEQLIISQRIAGSIINFHVKLLKYTQRVSPDPWIYPNTFWQLASRSARLAIEDWGETPIRIPNVISSSLRPTSFGSAAWPKVVKQATMISPCFDFPSSPGYK